MPLNNSLPLLLVMLFCAPAAAQVVARVEGEPIEAAEVQRLLDQTYGEREIDEAARPLLLAQALDQVIDRRLIQRHLETERLGASSQEVDAAIERFKESLAARDETYENFLERKGLSAEEHRREAAWQMSWRRYLGRTLTEEALKRYFEQFRQELDGTRLRVSHLLLKPEGKLDAESKPRLVGEAGALRKQIAAGELSFEEAVRRHSQGTKENGGDLGFIRRHGSMPEAFARAAYALKPGEVSQPVATPFGVHLIRVTDAEPGTKTLEDVRRELTQRAAQEEFRALAKRLRNDARIEFTGAMPYLDPDSGRLVEKN